MVVLCGAVAAQQPAAKVLALEHTIKAEKAGIRAAEVDPLGRTVLAGTFDGWGMSNDEGMAPATASPSSVGTR